MESTDDVTEQQQEITSDKQIEVFVMWFLIAATVAILLYIVYSKFIAKSDAKDYLRHM